MLSSHSRQMHTAARAMTFSSVALELCKGSVGFYGRAVQSALQAAITYHDWIWPRLVSKVPSLRVCSNTKCTAAQHGELRIAIVLHSNHISIVCRSAGRSVCRDCSYYTDTFPLCYCFGPSIHEQD